MDGSPRGNAGLPESSASAQAFEALSALVDSGRLAAGATLGEDEVAAMLGVSRTPAREAMQRLRELGLAESSAGRKTRISEVPVERVRDCLVVWSRLADVVVEQVVPDLDATALDAIVARMDGDLREVGRLSTIIRAVDALATLTGNPHLIRRMFSVSPVIRFGLRTFPLDAHAAEELDREIELFRASLGERSASLVQAQVRRAIELRTAVS